MAGEASWVMERLVTARNGSARPVTEWLGEAGHGKAGSEQRDNNERGNEMVYEYSWNGPQRAVDATTVGQHIEKLQQKYGEVTPDIFLESARSEKSKIHKLFEWDDTKAAEKYRKWQATNIICALKVTVIEEDHTPIITRAFVTTEERSTGYVHIRDAMSDEEKRESVIAQAKRDAQWYMDKYESLEELASVIEAMKNFVESVA